MFACSCLTHPFEAKACMLLSRKSLRSTCILFGYSFYIFLQLSVNLIKLIRNAFGNKTCLRVLVSPTSLKQKHACNASQFSLFFFKHARSCDEKSLRNTFTLFRCSFYIFLQLNVNSIKLIRNVFGNKTCLRVLGSPTFLKQKHACNAAVVLFQVRMHPYRKKTTPKVVMHFILVQCSFCVFLQLKM